MLLDTNVIVPGATALENDLSTPESRIWSSYLEINQQRNGEIGGRKKIGGEKLNLTLSGGANCGKCNSEGTLIPIHIEGGDITWLCTNCGSRF